MRLIHDWIKDAPIPGPRSVLTIGVFDGLHLGHQMLIREVVERAGALGAEPLLLTFEPHPLSVLSGRSAPEALTTFGQKRAILEGLGLGCLGRIHFTLELAQMGAEGFLDTVLLPRAEPAEIIVGADFRFGRGAEGGFDLLSSWSARRGSSLRAVEIQHSPGGEIYSSSHIRGLLKTGHVEPAAKLLGRPYRMAGRVVEGMKRGRSLGFPTANLGDVEQLTPGPGVYAVRALLGGRSLPGMSSVGQNPTFKGRQLTIETFIFDFSGDFYGEPMSLDFIRRIRGMIRFDSAEGLKKRLHEDEAQARRILAEAAPGGPASG
jgi:riboflavin kinase/FMN adenylyltransferase